MVGDGDWRIEHAGPHRDPEMTPVSRNSSRFASESTEESACVGAHFGGGDTP